MKQIFRHLIIFQIKFLAFYSSLIRFETVPYFVTDMLKIFQILLSVSTLSCKNNSMSLKSNMLLRLPKQKHDSYRVSRKLSKYKKN